MITWRAVNPAAPPPMMQISTMSPPTAPQSEPEVFVWLLSSRVCMGRAQPGRPRTFVDAKAGGLNHWFTPLDTKSSQGIPRPLESYCDDDGKKESPKKTVGMV